MYQHLLLSGQDVGSKRMTFVWGVVHERDGLSQTSGCLSVTNRTDSEEKTEVWGAVGVG